MESEEANQEMFDNELDFEEDAKEEKDASEEEDVFSDVETSQILLECEEAKIESAEGCDDGEKVHCDKDKKDDTEQVSSKSGSDGEISDSDGDKCEKPKGKPEGKVGDDREEGECSDGDDHVEMPSNRPRIPCRFFNRGFCNWGMNCKFIHAGFNDKGNYRMFEPMKHPAAVYNNENIHPMRMMRPPAPIAPRPEPVETKQETAWERGLRHAKEMMKQAQQRKETDIDFEDKKMNLSLGEDDILKEDVLYTRPASPLFSRSDGEDEENFPVPRMNINMIMDRPPMQRRMPYQGARNFNGRGGGGGGQHFRNDFNNQGFKGRGRGGEHYEERKRNAPGPGRGDEWSDPWMRKRSPNRRRKVSYSSGSSYSSSSRSRSRSYSSSSGSSRSSYSSYSSRSRSKRRSRSKSRSRPRLSPIARKEELYGKGMMNKPSSANVRPPARAPTKGQAVKAPVVAQTPKEEPVKQEPKKLLDYNPSFQNPPAPEKSDTIQLSAESGKENKKMSISPFGIQQAAPKTLPVNMLKEAKKAKKAAKKSKKIKKKKESDSESDSSSSSSASSSSSSSSSSSDSEEEARKKLKAKRKIVMDGREALANIVKISAMDALRMSGQKQQIKLKLKPSDGSAPSSEPLVPMQMQMPFESVPLARKRSTETSENEAPKAKKPTSSRREELLNQLKAIEDAIKKKRSKLH
ncbi:Hypothetical predicted protein [Cloeon dipterum]|uniref:C3H1-type domain-containing protein n=1 Tax=Cloeon dipterum TaxID=197152 RepID=A0A8S1CS80_9INSE|nr:Hypothetical predicted protein [Cloeon dipterum]